MSCFSPAPNSTARMPTRFWQCRSRAAAITAASSSPSRPRPKRSRGGEIKRTTAAKPRITLQKLGKRRISKMISDGGKEISVQGLLGMVRRRLLLVFIPMVALTVAVAFYAYRRPVLYRAQTLIGVESNTRDYIQRTEPNARVQDQLLTIRQVLLGRPVLEPVAANFHIFPA